MNSWWRGGAVLLAYVSFSSLAAAGVMVWGLPTPENLSIGANEIRLGCSGTAQSCLAALRAADVGQVEKAALAISTAATISTAADRAREYARLAKQTPQLREIGLDDFFGVAARIDQPNPEQFLIDLIHAAKPSGSGMSFGVTIYESELDRIQGSDRITLSVRALVDRVAFYMHHRQSVDEYETDLARVKRLFPNASIYAGIYNYDRTDYLSCRRGIQRKCTEAEELMLFREALALQVRLYRSGAVAGLEVYPGPVGEHESWHGWKNARICAPQRLQACLVQTRQMTKAVRQSLQ